MGRKQGVVNVKAPVIREDVILGMQEECYYSSHKIRKGVIDLAFEINKARRSHNTLKKWNWKAVRYHPRRVQPDIAT